jgi:hypothetical protein
VHGSVSRNHASNRVAPSTKYFEVWLVNANGRMSPSRGWKHIAHSHTPSTTPCCAWLYTGYTAQSTAYPTPGYWLRERANMTAPSETRHRRTAMCGRNIAQFRTQRALIGARRHRIQRTRHRSTCRIERPIDASEVCYSHAGAAAYPPPLPTRSQGWPAVPNSILGRRGLVELRFYNWGCP